MLIPDSDIGKIDLRVADIEGPRSGRLNLAGPFKARTSMCMEIPSRQRRWSSSVADATPCLLPILCRP
jgi:hypothetical protein